MNNFKCQKMIYVTLLSVLLIGFLSSKQVPLYASDLPAKPFPKITNSQDPKDTPLTPQQALKKLALPEGFNTTLFAGEPDIQQPIAFDIDDRGRLFVAESYTYLKHGWDSEGKQHRDRVVILEDTNFDGKHDKRTVFDDTFEALSGVTTGFDGVWVLSKGRLMWIADTNHDDKPDGQRVVHLDGFDFGPVGHNIVNGLLWGPDGWLYGRHGIQATSYVGKPGTPQNERTPMNCAIWRYHPTRHIFEVVAAGTTNPWGSDFNQHGQLFFTNNVIGHLWHVVPGSYYKRMYGKHFRDHLYQLMDQTADHYHWDAEGGSWTASRDTSGIHGKLGGGHSHCGGMIYLGDNWPKQYRGNMFMCNTHGKRVNQDIIVRHDTGYTIKHGKDIIFANQPWFRGIDLKYGPDGSVYLSDWTDIGECHDHDGVHRTSGRMYKIFHGEVSKLRQHKTDLRTLTDSKLVALQRHNNAWYARHARRILQERAAAGKPMSAVHSELRELLTEDDVVLKLRGYWGLYVTGGLNEAAQIQMLNHKEEHVRTWGIKFLMDGQDLPPAAVAMIRKMAWHEKSGLVRRFIASAMQKIPYRDRWQIAGGLANHQSDKNDINQTLMIWYGIEQAVAEFPRLALLLIETSQSDKLRQLTARRIMSEFISSPDIVQPMLTKLTSVNDDIRLDILNGMAEASRGWQKVTPPKNWQAVVDVVEKSDNELAKKRVRELSIVFGDGRAAADLKKIALSDKNDPTTRTSALNTLLEQSPDSITPDDLYRLLNDKAIRATAARGLAKYNDKKTPGILIGKFHGMDRDGQNAIIDTLASRLDYATRLVSEIDKRIPRAAISAYHARQMLQFNDPTLEKMLNEKWGQIRKSNEEKQAQLAKYKKLLTPEYLKLADIAKGKQLYTQICSACHKMNGAGGVIGPDLTGSNRDNLDYLLGNIIDPSAVMPEDFRASAVLLKDGRVIMGFIKSQDARTVKIQTMTTLEILQTDHIQEKQLLKVSLMPEGMLEVFTNEQVRDLIGYLMKK